MPTDLKISQFTDGGLVQETDEIAAVRSGVNTKINVGSAAAADVGTGPDDVPINSDLGGAAYLGAGSNVGDLVQLEDVGGSPGLPAIDGSQLTGVITESIMGLIEAGSNVTLDGSGTIADPYIVNSTSAVATSADDVTLDPISGLTATNVQDGIEEVWAVADTAVQPGSTFAPPTLHIQQRAANGVDAGATTTGAWFDRVLNTVLINSISGSSLSSGSITLPVGIYDFSGYALAYESGYHQTRLFNVTDNTNQLLTSGDIACSSTGYNVGGTGAAVGLTNISGRFQILATKTIKLQQRVTVAKAGNGQGAGSNTGFGTPNVFAEIILRKVA